MTGLLILLRYLAKKSVFLWKFVGDIDFHISSRFRSCFHVFIFIPLTSIQTQKYKQSSEKRAFKRSFGKANFLLVTFVSCEKIFDEESEQNKTEACSKGYCSPSKSIGILTRFSSHAGKTILCIRSSGHHALAVMNSSIQNVDISSILYIDNVFSS